MPIIVEDRRRAGFRLVSASSPTALCDRRSGADTDAVPEDEDRSRAADPSWADVVAPDDLRELTADVAAYHRELRLRRRQARLQRLVGHRRAFPLVVVSFALLVAAIVFAAFGRFARA